MNKQSPFHSAEAQVQNRYGLAELLAERYSWFIRPAMPDQHRRFYESQSMMIAGLTDLQGNVWAVPIFGVHGFVQTPSDKQLSINTTIALASAVDLEMSANAKVGLLGIELHTRRRNRVNGVIQNSKTGKWQGIESLQITIDVDQSYGNCPQYIHKRDFDFDENLLKTQLIPTFESSTKITEDAKKQISESDTFFIASRTKAFSNDPRTGIDASHRGGMPGFVLVEGNTLVFPDFSGNKFFNTIGNIEDDGRVGLVFPDFETGDALFISGKAKVLWDEALIDSYEGAERFIQIECENLIQARDYMPVTATYLQTSPSFYGNEKWNL